jgi:hypothetical protein
LPFGSKWEKVPCVDGSTRNILKNPQEIYKITYPDWEAKITGMVDILNKGKIDANANVKKTTDSIVKDLNQTYASMQSQYCQAYLAYCANPCSSEVETTWTFERNRILKKQTQLEKLYIRIQKASLRSAFEQRQAYHEVQSKGKRDEELPFSRIIAAHETIPESELKNILKFVRKVKAEP